MELGRIQEAIFLNQQKKTLDFGENPKSKV
jgi:hypothetical protein